MSADEDDTAQTEHIPKLRDLLEMAVIAFLMRVALCLISINLNHLTIADFANLRDGQNYIAIAKSFLGDSTASLLDQRVFPGYPAWIALLHLAGLSFPWSALGISWISVGANAALSAALFRDRRVGWAMVMLTPTYLLYSTMAMSEPLLLLLTLLGLLLARSGKVFWGGFSLGLSIFVRPVSVFAACCYALAEFLRRERLKAGVWCVASFIGATLCTAALTLWSGDPLHNIKVYATHPQAYGGRLFGWPFESMIMTPLHHKTAVWKILFMWAHVAITLTGCWLLISEWLRTKELRLRTLVSTSALWLCLNTMFSLCVDNVWGFAQFHRFIIPALPPLFFAYRRWLPNSRAVWLAVAGLCFLMALCGITHPPFLPHYSLGAD